MSFLSKDPIFSVACRTYVDNKPFSFIDPTGKIAVETLVTLYAVGYAALKYYMFEQLVLREINGYLTMDQIQGTAEDILYEGLGFAPGVQSIIAIKNGVDLWAKWEEYQRSLRVNNSDAQLRGQVYVNNVHTPGVKVEIYRKHKLIKGKPDPSYLLGRVKSLDTQGFADDGYFEFSGLPTGEDLMIVAYDPILSGIAAVEWVNLKPDDTYKRNLWIDYYR